MLKQIHDLGFNCIRLPWCNSTLTGTPSGIQINEYGVDKYTNETGLNLDLNGLSSIEVMDKIIIEAQKQGLYIILDNHSREPDGYMSETLWYTSKTSESKWISDWETIAKRYKSYSNVVGYDLDNEPHGNMGTGMKPPATWGYNQDGYTNTDWKAAAEKCGKSLLNVNSNALIIVEGTEMYKDSTYWWGGNLKGVKDYPITGIPKANLIYSPHEYGPEVYDQSWFNESDFPNNMFKIWDDNFWFIQKNNIAPILIGEFGIKGENSANPSSKSYKWLTTLMAYVGSKCSWTFWCMNPNSGDTGGLLKDDWVSVDQSKYNILKPYLASGSAITNSSSTKTVTSNTTNTITSTVTANQTSTTVPTSSNTNCSIKYNISNDWGTGSTISIMITNNGTSTLKGWTLTWTFEGNQTITSMWSVDYTATGNKITVTGKDSTASISAGQTVPFGMNITYSGANTIPKDFAINGTPCTIE
jgi:aryl-phospho-beta-D-glucosidase BglC (GH1 family)